MFTMVVGESSTGKSRYLAHLRETKPDSYMIGVDDSNGFKIDKNIMLDMFDNDQPSVDEFVDKRMAFNYLCDMCRDCKLLLVDEVGYSFRDYDDGRVISAYLGDIGRYKDVVSVTHDIVKLMSADRIVRVSWDGNTPTLHDITVDEAEKIING